MKTEWRNSPPVRVFIAQTSKTTQQHCPFHVFFGFQDQYKSLFLFKRWIQTPHVWLGWTEHPVAAEINGRGLFLPSFSQLRSLWNIVTWKDVMHCLVLRNTLSWAEIHHTAPSCYCSWGKLGIFSVFQQVRVVTSTQQCWIPLLHRYLLLQHPKYPIHCQSRRARTATTGGSPGWCLPKLQQKSLAGWTQAFRSEEQCKVSVMKCTSTGSPHSSAARSL